MLVDLALQGGGAHGAFTWGVLDCSSGSEPRNFLVVKCNASGFECSLQGSESMRIANMFFGFKIGDSPPMDACAFC